MAVCGGVSDQTFFFDAVSSSLIMMTAMMEQPYFGSMAPVMGMVEKTARKELCKPEIDLTVTVLFATT